MSKFQIITIGLFIVFIITGVVFFATYKGGGGPGTEISAITIWGTFPRATFDAYVSKVNQTRNQSISVVYTQKNQDLFSQEFISALARGQGPDAILIPADMLLPHLDKVMPIPYTALSMRAFQDTYIQEGELYLSSDGINAIPFLVDPLIMYWNRDTFSAAGLATYPKYWDEFPDLVQKLVTKDQGENIRRTAIAMGDFTNVANARELLGTLIMQSGNPITRSMDGSIESSLKTNPSSAPALQFFTQFVNPNHASYSWNRGMSNSKTAFLSGMLATYFGFTSELNDIRGKNPNLNFDAAAIPQLRSGGVKTTYGRMYGFSVLRSSPNQNSAYQIFAALTDPGNISQLEQTLYLPSVRRDIIAGGSNDAYITIFNQAALVARTWLDADPAQSLRIMRDMVNAVTSGAKSVSEAITDASDEYDVILRQAIQ